MGQDYTGLLRLRGSGAELGTLLQFQQAYGLHFAASNTRWSVRDDRIALEAAPLMDVTGFAADLASTSASRHAEFEGDGFALGLGWLDCPEARFALLTITDDELADFAAAQSKRGEDMLFYLADLFTLLDADALALGLNLEVGVLRAFLRGEVAGDGRGICVASGVPAASERAMRTHARVLETTLHGRRLLHSWLPGHDSYFR